MMTPLSDFGDATSLPIVAAVGILTLLLFLLHKHKKDFPPLPPNGPSFSEFIKASQNHELANLQTTWVTQYGEYCTIPSPFPGIPNQVMVAHPPTVRELTMIHTKASRFTTRVPYFAAATRKSVGTSVTGLIGEEWRWRKDALLKEFHRSRLMSEERGLLETIIKEGNQLCTELEKAATSGKLVEVDVLTTRAAVGVVLFFLFGKDDLKFDAEALRDGAKFLLDYLAHLLGNPLHSFLKYLPFGKCHDYEEKKVKAWKVVDSVVGPEIEQLLKEAEGETAASRKPGSVIASLIANEPRFRSGGVESMISEARVFVQAGFETTAHALAFCFGMLAERPDLADRLAQEGRAALGNNKNGNYTYEEMKTALEKAPTFKHFFLEAVRLYPLAPAQGGLCLEDIVITSDTGIKYGLPKGTQFYFPNIVLQRHPVYARGDDPNAIEPDRWNDTSWPFLHTFNNGPHSCPGKPLSLLEGQVFLLMAATRFRFEFPENGAEHVEYSDDLLLRPKDGMPLLVKKRD